MKTTVFLIFGILQGLSLGMIIFLEFSALNHIAGERVIGMDSQIMLSCAFPLFLVIVEYIIYTKRA